MADHRLRRFRLPRDLEESFSAELWTHGTLGLQILPDKAASIRIEAYFPLATGSAEAALELATWEERGVLELEHKSLPERDWLAEYRAAAQPLPLGRGFLVDPRDPPKLPPGTRDEEGRLVLSIPARNAFGTGSHESTRLMGKWMEALDLQGARVLDVGSGSGILAFVALALGASRVVGFDLDTPSVVSARANARVNGYRPVFYAGRLGALAEGPHFDLALVNILPERILDEIPSLLGLLVPGGKIVSSGNLWSRRQELLERFASHGLYSLGQRREGDWVSFLLAREPRAQGP